MARVQLLECSLNIKSNESTAAVVKRAHASGPMCFHLVLFEDDLTIPGFTYFPARLASFIMVQPVVMVTDDRSQHALCKIITSLCAIKS